MLKKQYSKDNHYKWGYNDSWFNYPNLESDNNIFKVQFGATKREVKSLREELGIALVEMTSQYTKPVMVGLSGGFDSQAVCLCLIDKQINFQAAHIRLMVNDNQVNEHETANAQEFCIKNNIDLTLIDLDLVNYYKTTAREYSDKYFINNARTIIQLHLVDKFKDTHSFLMAGGDFHLNFNEDFTVTTKLSFPIQHHLVENDIEGCTRIFAWSPELMKSYYCSDKVIDFIKAKESLIIGFRHLNPRANGVFLFSHYIKPLLFLNQFPELIQTRKFTGFENVMKMVNEFESKTSDIGNCIEVDFELIIQKLNSNELIEFSQKLQRDIPNLIKNIKSIPDDHELKTRSQWLSRKDASIESFKVDGPIVNDLFVVTRAYTHQARNINSNVFIGKNEKALTNWEVNNLNIELNNFLIQYSKDNLFSDGSRVLNSERFTVKMYEGSSRLIDFDDVEYGQRQSHRVLTSITFLNSDIEGGSIFFPEHDLDIKPEAGLTIVFPSNVKFKYGINKIEKGELYLLVQYFNVVVPL